MKINKKILYHILWLQNAVKLELYNMIRFIKQNDYKNFIEAYYTFKYLINEYLYFIKLYFLTKFKLYYGGK